MKSIAVIRPFKLKMEELGSNIKALFLAEPCFLSDPCSAEVYLYFIFSICHSRSKTFQPTYVVNMRDYISNLFKMGIFSWPALKSALLHRQHTLDNVFHPIDVLSYCTPT